MKSPTPADICAIIITYFPEREIVHRLRKIQSQTGYVIVVDNGSEPGDLAGIEKEIENRGELLRNPQNMGIATALNQGVRRSLELGYEWAITFDQDTEISASLVDELVRVLADYSSPEQVGVIAPNYADSNTGVRAIHHSPSKPYLEARTAITSGSLLSLAAFQSVGGFSDPLFIDLVDHDYCFRLILSGYHVLLATGSLMRHALGNRTRVRLPFGAITLMNSAPIRRYYVARNTIVLAVRYFRKFPSWVLRTTFLVFCVDAFIKIPLENNSLEKWKAVLLGIRDAVIGRTGPATYIFRFRGLSPDPLKLEDQ